MNARTLQAVTIAATIAVTIALPVHGASPRERLDAARSALEAAPSDPGAQLDLAAALEANDEPREALDAYLRALETGTTRPLAAQHGAARVERRLGERAPADARDARVLERYRAGEAFGAGELAAAAGAARALARDDPALFHTALRVYQEALARAPEDLAVRTALGELLLAKYNGAEALEVFAEVLERDPDHVEALLGLARSQHFDHSPAALESVARVLELAPWHAGARAFHARLLLEADDRTGAAAEASRALDDAPRSIEALTVLAGVRYVEGDAGAFDTLLERIDTLAPGDAAPLVVLAELAAQNRRYRESVRFAERALMIDRRAWRAHALLGVNRLRLGDIEGGRRSLELAFRGDPFDVWTKNSLDLLDTFTEYEQAREGAFEIVAHRDEARALVPWVAPLANEAYAHFAARYDARPPTPVRIEIYPRHEDLSVRTVGLVGVDILGVSFGPVVALDSPSARRAGEFNWGSTLWHELAHTFHLAMSDYRAPRWLSEGLAVHEERRARAGWGQDPSPDFLMALRDGRLPRMPALDRAFVRPDYPEQVVHAYYLASVAVELIERDHGADALVEMLRAFARGLDNATVVREVLGTDLEALDALVFDTLRARHGTTLGALADPEPGSDPLDSYPGAVATGAARHEESDLDGAEAAWRRAVALYPEHAGPGSARVRLAALHAERGQREAAIRELMLVVDIDGDTLEPHLELARLAGEHGWSRIAIDALERAVYIDPLDIDVHGDLAALYEQAERWGDAARALRTLVALGPRDPVTARHRLADALMRAGDLPGARRAVLAALETAPLYGPGLELLLEIRERMGLPAPGADG